MDRMLSTIKIGLRLGIGIGLIILFLASVIIFGINRMGLLSEQTVMIYDHPLTVSNAVLRINTNIIKIHRTMKDVALTQDIIFIQKLSKIVGRLEQEIYSDFEIIDKRFLGEKEKYIKALQLFNDWKAIRDEVIDLMRSGENAEAANITKGKGALHVVKIEEAMEVLGDFAQTKAKDFLDTTKDVQQTAFNTMYLLLLVSIAAGIVLAFFLTKSITLPVAVLRDVTDEVGKGKLDTKINIKTKDEIGQLANSFNKMTADLKNITASRDDLNKEIAVRKKAEDALEKSNEQLLQSQKMESLGIMAGGVAHEFNNMLTGITGYTEFLETPALESKERKKYTSGVLKICDRAKDLINQILSFSHQYQDEKISIAVEPIIYETIKLIKKTCSANIKIKYNTGKYLNPILANPGNIQQVVTNLCSNACHAMEDKGGLLEIKLSEENLDEKQLSNTPNLKPGSYIHLSVSDTGNGIDNNLLSKIFDPFFTTKDVGKGTGLGLSVVHGIIEKHNGKIDVFSEKGKGSIFHVYLPATKIEKEEKLFKEKTYKGTGKILVVDDEKDVRDVCEQMLANCGYKAHSVNSGLAAIKYYKENKDIDLFLLDMKMPGLDGKATYNALKEIDNNIKALVITGFSSHVYEDLLDIGIKGIVQKPFNKGELSKIVYETIKIKD